MGLFDLGLHTIIAGLTLAYNIVQVRYSYPHVCSPHSVPRRSPAFLNQSPSLGRIRGFTIRQSFARTLQEHTGCSVRTIHSFSLHSVHIEHRVALATGFVLCNHG